MVSWCDLCHSNNETSSHLFLFCRFACDISNWCSSLLNLQLTPISIIQMLNVCDRGWTRQCKEVILVGIINNIDKLVQIPLWYSIVRASNDKISTNV